MAPPKEITEARRQLQALADEYPDDPALQSLVRIIRYNLLQEDTRELRGQMNENLAALAAHCAKKGYRS